MEIKAKVIEQLIQGNLNNTRSIKIEVERNIKNT
jgi:hypothetical protein